LNINELCTSLTTTATASFPRRHTFTHKGGNKQKLELINEHLSGITALTENSNAEMDQKQ